MMAYPTQNANALAFAQSLVDFAAQARSLLALGLQIQESQASKNYAANLQAMPTYTVASDGSQGATDGSPQQGNPIVGLNLKFYDLDQARSEVVNAFVTMMTNGGAVSAEDRRLKIDQLLP